MKIRLRHIFNNNHSRKKLKQQKECFLNLDDYINANYNYESLHFYLASQPNSNKNYKNFVSYAQEDLVPITFNKLIPGDKIRKNDSKNMNISQNDVQKFKVHRNG